MPKVNNLRVRNLGQVGLITDVPPQQLPANVWTSGLNVRFRDQRISRIGGYASAMDDAPEEAIGLFYFNGTWIWGSATKLYQYEPGVGHSVRYPSPDTIDASEKWTFSNFSGILVASHPDTDPVYWNGVTQSADSFNVLPGWGGTDQGPVTWRAKRLRTYRNQLIALNTTEDGVEYKTRIRFSDIAQPNQVPAEWQTLTTNSAGFIDLSNATGEIVDGVVLGNSFVIYTENEVYVMDYVGGNQIYTVRQVFNDGGALQEGCVASFNNQHLVITADDVYIHNGSSKQSVIDGKIKKAFFDAVSSAEFTGGTLKPRVEALTYKALNEIWIFYTAPLQEGDSRTYYKRAAIWNYNSGTWSYTEVPNLTDLALGPIPSGAVPRWDTLPDDFTWDTAGAELWDQSGKDIEDKILIGCGGSKFWALDQDVSKVEGVQTVPFLLERTKIDFDDEIPQIPFRVAKTLAAIYPQFKGSGKVYIRVGYSLTSAEEPTWTSPVEFNIATDEKADFRVTGKYFSIRIDASDENAWDLEGMIVQLNPFTQQR